jgi:hypothetical protein
MISSRFAVLHPRPLTLCSFGTNGRMISGTCPVAINFAIASPVIPLSNTPNPPCPLAMITFFQEGSGPKIGRESGVFGRKPAHILRMEQDASAGRS